MFESVRHKLRHYRLPCRKAPVRRYVELCKQPRHLYPELFPIYLPNGPDGKNKTDNLDRTEAPKENA